MKRSVVAVGAGAITLSVVAIPVGATMLNQDATAASVAVADSGVEAQDAAGTASELSLAGTSLAFLLLGAGTLTVAHRRRWRTIDLRGVEEDAPTSSAAQRRS